MINEFSKRRKYSNKLGCFYQWKNISQQKHNDNQIHHAKYSIIIILTNIVNILKALL